MNMNSKHVAALLAASAMAFGISASAQSPQPQQPSPGYGCYGMGPGMGPGGHMKGDPAAFAEQRLTQLKSELKITPQQEPLWQAFADKVKSNAGQMQSMQGAMRQQQMPAPERMNRMIEHMKTHLSAMEATSESFKRLYDALTPEQKVVADKFQPFGGRMGSKRGGRGGMGMGPGGGMGPGMGGPAGQAPQGQGGTTSR